MHSHAQQGSLTQDAVVTNTMLVNAVTLVDFHIKHDHGGQC